MMRDTPRTFVGPMVLLLDGPAPADVAEAVRLGLRELPGIRHCDLDAAAGTLVITAQAPVDRTDVMAVLDRLGCRVRA